MESIIEKMIEEREARIRAEKEEAERKEKEIVEGLLSSLQSYLGDFWKILEERVQKTGEKYTYSVSRNNSRSNISIEYKLPALPEYELSPIGIDWNGNPPRAGYSSSYIFHTRGRGYSSLDEALAAAREGYPDYMEERAKKAREELWSALPHTSDSNAEETASRVFEAHVTKYPDLIPQAREKYESWKESRANWIRSQEEARRAREIAEAEKALRDTIRIGYISELAEWMKESDRINKSNKAAAARIQSENDKTPYTVYKLTYAMVATYHEDGEEYREIETRSVYTLYSIPDSFGFWDINGKKTKFFEPVTLEMEFVKASLGICAKSIEIAGIEIFFAPESPEDFINRVYDEISPLPEEPKKPIELSRYSDRDLRREAFSLLTGEDDRSEDF